MQTCAFEMTKKHIKVNTVVVLAMFPPCSSAPMKSANDESPLYKWSPDHMPWYVYVLISQTSVQLHVGDDASKYILRNFPTCVWCNNRGYLQEIKVQQRVRTLCHGITCYSYLVAYQCSVGLATTIITMGVMRQYEIITLIWSIQPLLIKSINFTLFK